MQKPQDNSQFSISNSQLFWDTDPATLDPEKNKTYIIPRVMDYGSLEDVRNIFAYYGKDQMLAVLKDLPYLDKKTLSFCEVYFGVPRKDFRAYQRRLACQTWK
jgi:hypothetical protein